MSVTTIHNLDLTQSMTLHERAVARIPGGAQTNSKRPSQFALGGYPIYADRGKAVRLWMWTAIAILTWCKHWGR